MRLTLLSQYKSISQFNDVELDDFSVLTGKNGSGKTHILEAIKNGAMKIDDFGVNEILFFNYDNLYVPPISIEQEKAQNKQKNENILHKHYIGFYSLKDKYFDVLENYQSAFSKIDDLEQRKEVEKLVNDFLSDWENGTVSNLQEYFFKKNKYYEINKKTPNRERVDPSIDIAQSILGISTHNLGTLYAAAIQSGKKIEDLVPSDTEQLSPHIQNIAELQVAWMKRRYTNAENKFCSDWEKDTIFIEQGEWDKRYSKPPIDQFNETLDEYNFNDYRLSYTDAKIRAANFNKFGREHLGVRIEDKSRSDLNIDWNDLSSGEKILMALSVLIFKHGRTIPPKVLLLDEVDAVMHPSNTKDTIDIIQQKFVKHGGMKVIFASHSPTTVAISDNVYLVEHGDVNDKIKKVDNNDALSALTAGYVTVQDTLKFLRNTENLKLVIFTEGNNIQYINMAIELLCPDLKQVLRVVTGIENKSGVRQLNVFYQLMMDLNNSIQMLFVWDPDAKLTDNLSETKMVKKYRFDKNEDSNVGHGIESVFPAHLFLDEERFFTRSKKDTGGHRIDPNKSKIRDFILSRRNKDDFENFQHLIDRIIQLCK